MRLKEAHYGECIVIGGLQRARMFSISHRLHNDHTALLPQLDVHRQGGLGAPRTLDLNRNQILERLETAK